MKILKVIHGFPPDYMAGSEVYSFILTKELNKQGINTSVFTRVENEFDKPYKIYEEVFNNINIYRINKPQKDYCYEDKFYDEKIEKIFTEHLKNIKPDLIHFGHLSHLSINLAKIAKTFNLPLVFTIHDFWLFCVKGQMLNKEGKICPKPSIEACLKCSNYPTNKKQVKKSFKLMEELRESIDIFISPSRFLQNFFIENGVDKEKIIYQKYGFETKKIKEKKFILQENKKLRFAFMGRLIPSKGIKILSEAFKSLPEEKLEIYGNIGSNKRFLEAKNIIFKGKYNNNNINAVLENIDILIVPSIWYENSPLVIQEALLAGVIVLTSELGGMAELIQDGVNGFTFKANDTSDLIAVIKKLSQNPKLCTKLDKKRKSSVASIEDDVKKLKKIYKELVCKHQKE